MRPFFVLSILSSTLTTWAFVSEFIRALTLFYCYCWLASLSSSLDWKLLESQENCLIYIPRFTQCCAWLHIAVTNGLLMMTKWEFAVYLPFSFTRGGLSRMPHLPTSIHLAFWTRLSSCIHTFSWNGYKEGHFHSIKKRAVTAIH